MYANHLSRIVGYRRKYIDVIHRYQSLHSKSHAVSSTSKRIPVKSNQSSKKPHISTSPKTTTTSDAVITEYTVENLDVVDKKSSNRVLFKQNAINPSVLKHLDEMHLGYIAKKRILRTLKSKSKEDMKNPSMRQEYYDKQETPILFRKIGTHIATIPDGTQLQSTLYPDNPPEVAIIGRSNVGKSSLLNRLLGYNDSYIQKSSVSEKPGETKDLKLYGVRMKKDVTSSSYHDIEKMKRPWSLIVTDMPGYGFAYWNENDRSRCMELCRQYLLYRGHNLKRVLLLLDARHGFKLGDKEFFQELLTISQSSSLVKKVAWKLQIILTKCDLLDRHSLARRIADVEAKMKEMLPGVPGNMLQILPISSLENKGIIQLQKELASLVPPQPDDFIPTVKTSSPSPSCMRPSSDTRPESSRPSYRGSSDMRSSSSRSYRGSSSNKRPPTSSRSSSRGPSSEKKSSTIRRESSRSPSIRSSAAAWRSSSSSAMRSPSDGIYVKKNINRSSSTSSSMRSSTSSRSSEKRSSSSSEPSSSTSTKKKKGPRVMNRSYIRPKSS